MTVRAHRDPVTTRLCGRLRYSAADDVTTGVTTGATVVTPTAYDEHLRDDERAAGLVARCPARAAIKPRPDRTAVVTANAWAAEAGPGPWPAVVTAVPARARVR